MNPDVIVCRNLWSPVGDMIAGSSPKGICFLEWHSRGGVETIRQRVEKRYKLQVVDGNHAHLDTLQHELGDYFEGSLSNFQVPVHLEGTSFELQVWGELVKIPFGATRSYAEVAQAVNRPQAFRAVGRANGANYVSIVVPCHRVIETSGKLRGYGGGLWRKKYLLELEGRKKQSGLAA